VIKAGTALKLLTTGGIEAEATALKPRGVTEHATAIVVVLSRVVFSRGCMPCFALGRTDVATDTDPARFGVAPLARNAGVMKQLCVDAALGGKPPTLCTDPVARTQLSLC